MSQYTSISPAETGIVSGVIGAGIGYTLAPRKYNLEQLFTQDADVFEKTLPKKVMEKTSKDQKAAYNLITDAREYLEKSNKNSADTTLAAFLDSPKYSRAYRKVKSFIPKAKVQSAVVLGFIGTLVGVIGKIAFGDNNY